MRVSLSKNELKNLINSAVVGVLENVGLLEARKKAKNEKSLPVRHKDPNLGTFKHFLEIPKIPSVC